MLCFHAQHKECLSPTWNADLSFFLITLSCSYISIRAIAQQSLAGVSAGFSETQTTHKKAISDMRLHLSQYHIVLYWYYLPYHLWLQMLLSTHTEPLFGKKIMGWALSCLSETLKISVALHQFQAQSLSHFLQWWRGLRHFLWMKRLFSRMNKCLCDDSDLHRGFSQVGQAMTAAESWFSTQSSLERWACRSSGPQNHPQVHYLPVLFVWGDFLQKINIKLIMKQTALNGVSAYRMTMSFQYFTVISSWSGPDSDKIEKIV